MSNQILAIETQYTVPDEATTVCPRFMYHLMYKTSNPNTGGSQFFLIPEDKEPSQTNGVHTVFGEITSGCNHVTAISEVPTGAQDKPIVMSHSSQ